MICSQPHVGGSGTLSLTFYRLYRFFGISAHGFIPEGHSTHFLKVDKNEVVTLAAGLLLSFSGCFQGWLAFSGCQKWAGGESLGGMMRGQTQLHKTLCQTRIPDRSIPHRWLAQIFVTTFSHFFLRGRGVVGGYHASLTLEVASSILASHIFSRTPFYP